MGGKTTTTERMLYFAGTTEFVGNVDDGDTVTDYLEQERKRGITITSAAVTFYWKQHRLNLIDTPGHVDFTLEVERSLRVLDGAVTVLDASAGVQAQTVTVWRQAVKFGIPSVLYINKMDLPSANVKYCLETIEKKLKMKPLLLCVPNAEGKGFSSFVDLVNLKSCSWPQETDGRNFKILDVTENMPEYSHILELRQKLLEAIAECDDEFAEAYLNSEKGSTLSADFTTATIRRLTLNRKCVPVCVGSSLKNKGIQMLLDNIVTFLPAPTERSHPFLNLYGNNLCCLAFKLTRDADKHPLWFVRVYNGVLKKTVVFNINRATPEHINKVFIPHADELEDVPEIPAGNIAVVSGPVRTMTGDTLVQSKAVCNEVARKFQQLHESQRTNLENVDEAGSPVLAGIEAPEPVFFCSFEAQSQQEIKPLLSALETFALEDPSFRVREDEETRQTIVEGMGELHIEIVKDRLKTEYGLEAYVGPLQVQYREGILSSVEQTMSESEAGTKRKVTITLSLTAEPTAGPFRHTLATFHKNEEPLFEHQDYLRLIEEGIQTACRCGPKLAYPVQGFTACVTAFEASRDIAKSVISLAAAKCAIEAFKAVGTYLLEPLTRLEVTTEPIYVNAILADLSNRRAQIDEVGLCQETMDTSTRVIHAVVPLAELSGYVGVLRNISSGTALLHMEMSGYHRLKGEEEKRVIKQITGIS